MSLYGALFGGVSGLKAQGSKIGVISDNIANVNTVGYKQSQALFETMVVNSNSVVSYQTGGVRGESRMAVDKQGLLLSTDSPTDIAISGRGFFTVNAKVDGSAQPLYTRAGSFRQDNLGNFVNAAGFYLQGWPLDRDGRLPGEVGNPNTTSFANLDSLETVNVSSTSGVAQATTLVSLGVQLDAGERIYPGAGTTVTMDRFSPNNYGISGSTIIVPSEYGMAGANRVQRGDTFELMTGGGLVYEYQYGGFSIGRQVTGVPTNNSMTNVGDNNRMVDVTSTVPANMLTTNAAGSSVITVTAANHGLVTGDEITLSGMAGFDGISAAALNTTHAVTFVDANTYTITVAGTATAGGVGNTGGAPETIDTRQYTGNIFNAQQASQNFFGGGSGISRFTTAALSFTISTSTDTHTFTYAASSPNTSGGQFNSLNTLATAIDTVAGLSARVVNGRLVVSAEDANSALVFTNGDAVTNTGTRTGIDWVSELGFADVAADVNGRRYNSMSGLAAIVNADEGVSAVVNNPLSNATLDINVDDPLDTIRFRDIGQAPITIPAATAVTVAVGSANPGENMDVTIADATHTYSVGDLVYITGETNGLGGLPGTFPNGGPWEVVAVNAGADYTFRIPGTLNTTGVTPVAGVTSGAALVSVVGESNQGSILGELGMATSLSDPGPGPAAYAPADTGILGPRYDASGTAPGQNMASGDIVAQFSRNVRIYDALGAGHELRYSFLKIAENTWAVEIHAIPESDVSSALPNGQVATGTINFNGDGSLRSISSGLLNPINVAWTNGAIPSTINVNWGEAGLPFGTPGATVFGSTDGMSQFDSTSTFKYGEQNGTPVGELVSVSIDGEGYVIAAYSNGETQRLYKLPLADFANPNGLKAISGNVFAETRESGTVNLRESGTNGVGDVVSASLEQSNVELSEQLTDMIVAQRAYQANTRVISTTDELLEELTRL